MKNLLLTLLFCMIGISGFAQDSCIGKRFLEVFRNSEDVVTLYRGSFVSGVSRVNVATLDADESYAYNWENCNIAADLFKAQEGVKVKYWCEKGLFKE